MSLIRQIKSDDRPEKLLKLGIDLMVEQYGRGQKSELGLLTDQEDSSNGNKLVLYPTRLKNQSCETLQQRIIPNLPLGNNYCCYL